MFLKYYFGSFCPIPWPDQNAVEVDPNQGLKDAWAKLNMFDRFVRMLTDQLQGIFLRYDSNKNLTFEADEI